jgi:hypothetical protein
MEYEKVQDSGERRDFETGSVRDVRKGKGRFDLIPTHPMRRLARHYENGAVKYGDRNWEKGQPLFDYLDSAWRHLLGVIDNKQNEDHAAAAVWNIFAYMFTRDKIENGQLPIELDSLGHCKMQDPGIAPMTMESWKRIQAEKEVKDEAVDYEKWCKELQKMVTAPHHTLDTLCELLKSYHIAQKVYPLTQQTVWKQLFFHALGFKAECFETMAEKRIADINQKIGIWLNDIIFCVVNKKAPTE